MVCYNVWELRSRYDAKLQHAFLTFSFGISAKKSKLGFKMEKNRVNKTSDCMMCDGERRGYVISVYTRACLKRVPYAPWHFIITWQMWTDFQNSFTHWFVRKFSRYIPQRFPSHLQYVATLPCDIRKSKNVTEFSRWTWQLLRCLTITVAPGPAALYSAVSGCGSQDLRWPEVGL